MEEIIVLVIQFLTEFVFQLFMNAGIWPFPSSKPNTKISAEAAFLWLILGGTIGWIWSLILPQPFIHSPPLRILNLCISPPISGLIASRVAALRARRNPDVIPRKHFWYSFWFALGMVALRFAYLHRL